MIKITIYLSNLLFLAFIFGSCSVQNRDISVIPRPLEVSQNSSDFKINQDTKIFLDIDDIGLLRVANYFTTIIQPATGFNLQISDINNSSNPENAIIFKLSQEIGNVEAYELQINNKQIVITANSPNGIFYGLQTIRQLLPPEIESKKLVKDVKWEIRGVEVKDEPRFRWRGMHMDVSRHFFSVDEVKEFIDYLAMYKINTYHMHLTDDQGWRLEIKKYPELTNKGAWRVHTNHDSTCIRLAAEDNTFEIPQKHYQTINGETRYGGFYTQEEMKELIKYAEDRFITIIPEIDIPGHFMAAMR